MRSLLNILPNGVKMSILDVGAALSEAPPYQPLVDAGRARIVGFEPDSQECEKLTRKYGNSHKFYPYFAGDGGTSTYYQTNWPLTGSLLEPNTELLEKFNNLSELCQPVAEHPTTTKRIDDIGDIRDIDFIKIDVQGSELAVLENAVRVLSTTLLVQIEVEFVELYKGQPLFADIDRFLRGQGFQFHTFDGFGTRAFKPLLRNGDVNAGFRQILWSDAIYVRDWMKLDQMSEIKLKKYAVLAHDLLNSCDLANLALMALDRKTKGNFSAAYLEKLTGKP
ncbi:SAM-dependent methyltransferase, FkbM family [Rhodospirillaceae bacterium LM-1]|nr:SAM-dependent methyltransferase, FkbM family [Rhodospirillaceae bacterium LM-1]